MDEKSLARFGHTNFVFRARSVLALLNLAKHGYFQDAGRTFSAGHNFTDAHLR